MPKSKPDVSTQNPKLANEVMDKITSGNVHMRSRTTIAAEALVWLAILVGAFILAILASRILAAWWLVTGHGSFLGLGPSGWQAFFEAFPLGWFALGLIGVLGGLVILRHYDISYKLPFSVLVALVALGSILFGYLFATFRPPAPYRNQLHSRLRDHRPPPHHVARHGLVGEVRVPERENLTVLVNEREVHLLVTSDTRFLPNDDLREGDLIRAAGQYEAEDQFRARVVRRLPR